MNLKHLTEEKKVDFLKIAKIMMEADGKIVPQEEELFDKLCLELMVYDTEQVFNNAMNYELILEELDRVCTKEEKRILAFEIITIACADEKVVESENTIIKKMQEIFEISNEDIETMLYLSKELIDLQQDIRILINK